MTLQERLIRFLKDGMNMTEEKGTRKYCKFVGKNITLWIGKNGAARSGRTISESISLTSTVISNMKLWETRTSQNI